MNNSKAMTGDAEETIDTLNDLIENCRDGEYGFRACAEHVKADDIRALFNRRAEDCATAATQLEAHVVRLGGKPDSGGTATGAAHRGWVAVRGALSSYTDLAMLEECERGEDAALSRYSKALDKPLEPAVRALVEEQRMGTKANHDQIRAMRDRLRALA